MIMLDFQKKDIVYACTVKSHIHACTCSNQLIRTVNQ